MPPSRIAELKLRIEDYEEAIATFARLHEELADLRANTPLPEAAARLDVMLRLNAETLDAIKRSLTHAISALKRVQLDLEPATASR